MFQALNFPIIVTHNVGSENHLSVPHLHPQFEIYYNISGGQGFFINNLYYQVEPHDLFVIPNTQVHKAVVNLDVVYDRCVINFDPKIIAELNSMPFIDQQPLEWLQDIGTKQPHRVHLNEKQHKKYIRLLNQYRRIKGYGMDLKRIIKLLEILLFVGELFDESAEIRFPTSAPTTWSDKAIQYIEKNIDRDFTIKEIAQSLFIHEKYLCKIFKAQTGMTVNRYIILRRIAEAKRLLYGGASVKDACSNSGFNDYSNFIRTFKKEVGVSPGRLPKLN